MAIKTVDPRLAWDLFICEFLVAFSIYCDMICSVYPDRGQEFDPYLVLIADLNFKQGLKTHPLSIPQSLFQQSCFSSQTAWLLVMLIGGSWAPILYYLWQNGPYFFPLLQSAVHASSHRVSASNSLFPVNNWPLWLAGASVHQHAYL